MNAVAGRSRGVVRTMAKECPIAFVFGAVSLVLAAIVAYGTWMTAWPAVPRATTYTMWLKPQAQVVVRDGRVDLDAPRVYVQMNEFQKHAENSPYIVSYWAGWQHGSSYRVEGDNAGHQWQVWYLLKKPGTDVYLYTMEIIPWNCEGYRCDTRFDGRSTFEFTVGEQNLSRYNVGRAFAIGFFALGILLLGSAYYKSTRYCY